MVGRTIAHFRVVARIGAGAMGEIYRAFDTQLQRDVALKVLAPAVAADHELTERLAREARLLAALNHPNVAAIYGLADASSADAPPALVMELVEGPTLADELANGPIAVPKALEYARQVAEALEYAHDRGVIHRDLKPANIKLTEHDQIKILDFGLAKALTDERGASSSQSTVLSSATRVGAVIGTPAYMPPEQAKGKVADRRSDIWSFGVVLYEMLTGAKPFGGETVSEALASVIRDEPDWAALPAATPPAARDLLKRCLAKDVRTRLQAIGEARIALERAIANPSGDTTATPVATRRPSLAVRLLPWAVAAVFAGLALALWAPWRAAAPAPTMRTHRFNVELSHGVTLKGGIPSGLGLSPDGSMLAFLGLETDSTIPRIYLKRLDEISARPLAGTEGANGFFFSPDGAWIGFFADSKMKKIPSAGGDVMDICPVGLARGGSWTDDHRIVLATNSRSGLSIVSDNGGTPQPLTKLDVAAGEITHRFPQVLPGGNVIFTSHTNSESFDEATIKVVSLAGGSPRDVLQGGFLARYISSGHLLYMNGGTLHAVPFDLKRLTPTGTRVPVVHDVRTGVGSALAEYAVSDSDVLTYISGAVGMQQAGLSWLKPDGTTEEVQPPGRIQSVRLSPNGRLAAVQVFSAGQSHIEIYDIQRGTFSPLTSGGANEQRATWTPDSSRVAYSSDREKAGAAHLYWRRVDGVGPEQRLTSSNTTEREIPGSFTPDGHTLLFNMLPNAGINSKWTIMKMAIDGSESAGWTPRSPEALAIENTDVTSPELSPDGRWLAYVAALNVGGGPLYVRRYPELDHREAISVGAVVYPTWSRTSHDLYFLAKGNRITVVGYTGASAEFGATKPRVWADVAVVGGEGARSFDVPPDGGHVMVLKGKPGSLASAAAPGDKAVVVLGLGAELQRLMQKK